MEFNVTLADPAVTAPCFDDLMNSVKHSLTRLGHTVVDIGGFDPQRVNVVFGYHLAPQRFRHRSIVYQLEPVARHTVVESKVPVELLKRHVVWEYSRHHVEQLRGYGVAADYVQVGYSPDLQRVRHVENPDIDVLFYGSLSPRRVEVIRKLAAAGLRVEVLCGAYGAERDEVIGRSKVVLNMHSRSEYRALESVRIGYLLANRKAVVSEANPGDDLDGLGPGIVGVRHDDLVAACVELVASESARKLVESTGFQLIAARDEQVILADALRRTVPVIGTPLQRA